MRFHDVSCICKIQACFLTLISSFSTVTVYQKFTESGSCLNTVFVIVFKSRGVVQLAERTHGVREAPGAAPGTPTKFDEEDI